MAILLQDNFDRANSTSELGNPQTGPSPTIVGGTLGISGNLAYATVLNGMAMYDLGTPNVEISLDASNLATTAYGAGVILDYISNTNMWAVELRYDYVGLFRSAPGGYYEVMRKTRPVALTTGVLRVNYRDGIIRVYVDNVLMIWFEVDIPFTSTKSGFRISGHLNVRVDNLLGADSPVVNKDSVGDSHALMVVPTDPLYASAFAYKGHDTKLQDQQGS